MLPTDAKKRKDIPITRGLLDYFPDACAAVAELSRIGNEQHSPGQPMHWAREKSTDHADCIVRHLVERGKPDTDGVRHSAKVAWRALALLQTEIEFAAKEEAFDEAMKHIPAAREDYPSRWLMRDLGGHEWETSNEYTHYNAAMLFNCSTPILRLLAGGISKQDETTCDDIPHDHAPSCPCYVCAKARRDATGQWEPNDDTTAC